MNASITDLVGWLSGENDTTASVFKIPKFPVNFPVLREFGTASLGTIGGEGVSMPNA
jgi:hypothetical protein